MPPVPQILQLRLERSKRKEHRLSNRLRPLGIGCGLFISLVVALGLIAATIFYSTLTRNLPSIEAIPALIEQPSGLLSQPTRLYDRTGAHILFSLEEPGASGHAYLPVSQGHNKQLPDSLIEATIASADPDFNKHAGFSWDGLLTGSHPTLAQQLVSDLLLWEEPPGLRRSLRERILAWQITSQYGRLKVLEWYLNSTRYGRYLFGADAASRAYFDKSASELNLTESAFLAGIAQAPAISPLDSPQTVLEQKNRILESMFQQGFITSVQFSQALQEKPDIQSAARETDNPATAFTQFVLDQLSRYLDFDRLSRGGYKVITSLDYDLQLQSTCTAEMQLARISGRAISSQSLTQREADCQASRLLPTSPSSTVSSDSALAANVIILDPQNGQILSMVGDPTPGHNPAGLPGHPPGSLITPFIYLTAFTRGMGPASLLWDVPTKLEDEPVDIANPDGKFHGPVRLRTALANDYLLPAIEILKQMGSEQVWQIAIQLGLDNFVFPSGPQSLRLPSEGGEVTLLEISQAFGSLANQGVLVGLIPSQGNTEENSVPIQPVSILSVEDNQGQVWLDCNSPIGKCQTSSRSVISPQLAYLANHVLSDETARWPSLGHPNSLEVGRPAAVKNGQTKEGKDSWSVGYTPGLVIGTWIGNTDPLSQEKISANWAAGLWHALIQYTHRDQPVEDWAAPAGISQLQVCDPSGLLPTSNCPNVVNEISLTGNEPTVPDTLFQTFQVNRETGRLATLLTPAELVDEKVYMVLPSEAQAWAQQSGIPSAPQAYDVIDFSASVIPDLAITSPEMFDSVSGKISVQGRASGSGFDYYRLQTGSGLNPSQWLQIGEDANTPVEDGLLAIWDTSGLSGLFALQLLVVNQDETVQSTIVQVTVDNQAPDVSIRFPEDNQVFDSTASETLTFQAEASDDLESVTVQFIIDDELLETRTVSPYVSNWPTKPGSHVLKVVATDRAGNTAQDQIEFTVQR